MVYVSGGTVCQSPPWSIDRLIKLFYGVIAFVVLFFKSLVGMDTSNSKSSSSGGFGSSSFRGSGGGGGGGGGRGGRPGPGGGGGGPRFKTMRDINPPTVNAGGCPGGACGM